MLTLINMSLSPSILSSQHATFMTPAAMPPTARRLASSLNPIFSTVRPRSSPRRPYSTHPQNARLNIPTDFSATPILHHTSSSALSNPELPASARHSKTTRQNLFQAINSALRHALSTDERVLLFGEDVAFGGVFRASMGLATDFGSERVFNTPLTEQGIVGFAIGCAMEGMRPVAEIQFADYVYPAFDQLVNEAAKVRYRTGSLEGMHAGGLVVRMPCGGVGHGALYVCSKWSLTINESIVAKTSCVLVQIPLAVSGVPLHPHTRSPCGNAALTAPS